MVKVGIRLPKPMEQIIGIVCGRVIGETTVNVGIVNSFLVTIITITYRILLFVFLLATTTLSLHGIILALIALAIHITNLRVLLPLIQRLLLHHFI